MNSLPSCLDGSAVHLDELADDCQSDTQSTLRAIQRSRCLSEKLKDVRKCVRGDTHPRVFYTQHHLIAFLLKTQPDVTAFRSVFRSVVEKVYDHFLEAERVCVQPHRFWRQRYS
jgi:hypothetical protein